ncbi:MAG: hypothetical protein KF791_00780 [Verrucomicrobiae bacterium]|nr:hypothetical protein [Verrucomicrobiae bacterium]
MNSKWIAGMTCAAWACTCVWAQQPGALDPRFAPPPDLDVGAVALLGDGRMLVGGSLAGLHSIQLLSEDGTPDACQRRF